MHTTDCSTFDEEDDDAMIMDVPFPSVWIGSEAFRSVVCSSTLLSTSQVDVHSVVYLPSSQSLFKKPKLDSAPSVNILVLYPKSGGSENLYGKWTGITKLLDPVMKSLDADEADYNGGACGLGYRVVEDVMMPIMKKRRVLVVNVWGGGNITEVVLVSFNPPLLYTPIGWQPIQVAMNIAVPLVWNKSLPTVFVAFRFSVVSTAGRYVLLQRFCHH
jgi:hypothetical protein